MGPPTAASATRIDPYTRQNKPMLNSGAPEEIRTLTPRFVVYANVLISIASVRNARSARRRLPRSAY